MKNTLLSLSALFAMCCSSCFLLLEDTPSYKPAIYLSISDSEGLLGCTRAQMSFQNCTSYAINSFDVELEAFDSNNNCIGKSRITVDDYLSPDQCSTENVCVGYYDDFSHFYAEVSFIAYE